MLIPGSNDLFKGSLKRKNANPDAHTLWFVCEQAGIRGAHDLALHFACHVTASFHLFYGDGHRENSYHNKICDPLQQNHEQVLFVIN